MRCEIELRTIALQAHKIYPLPSKLHQVVGFLASIWMEVFNHVTPQQDKTIVKKRPLETTKTFLKIAFMKLL